MHFRSKIDVIPTERFIIMIAEFLKGLKSIWSAVSSFLHLPKTDSLRFEMNVGKRIGKETRTKECDRIEEERK
jgi:hypothetical protein